MFKRRLLRRIEGAYLRAHPERGTNTRGARAWMADMAHLHPTSISRMLRNQLPASRIESILDALEYHKPCRRPSLETAR